jgi:hypothetical protein
MQDLGTESLDLFRAQGLGAGDVFVASRVLGDQRAFADDITIVFQALDAAEIVDVF